MYIRTSEHGLKSPNIACFFEGIKISNFYYVFPIYNSKLHDICSTSNLVYPPFKAKIAVFTTFKDPISLWTFLYYFLIHDSKLYNTYMFNVNLQKGAVAD